MARNCSICGNKIGFLAEGSFLGRNEDIFVCDTCFIYAQKLHISAKDDVSKLHESRKYFNKYIQAGTISQDVVEELKFLLSQSESNEEKTWNTIIEKIYSRQLQDIILRDIR